MINEFHHKREVEAETRQDPGHWRGILLWRLAQNTVTIDGGRYLTEDGVRAVEALFTKALAYEREKTRSIEGENKEFAKTINYMKKVFAKARDDRHLTSNKEGVK